MCVSEVLAVQRRDGSRCAVASRELRAGTTILLEDPWAVTLLRQETRCEHCFGPTIHPARCSDSNYVGRNEWDECCACEQRAALALAASAKRQGVQGDPWQRLPPAARLALRTVWRGLNADKKPWSELETHWDDLDAERQASLETQALACLDVLMKGLSGDDQAKAHSVAAFGVCPLSFSQLLAAIDVNAMVLTGDDQGEVALGLLLHGAAFNHSEVPNCTQSFKGRQLLVRARRAIGKGEELTLAYCELAEPSDVRRAKLQKQYFFDPLRGLTEQVSSAVALRDQALSEILEKGADGWQPGWIATWDADSGVREATSSAVTSLLEEVHHLWAQARQACLAGEVASAARFLHKAWRASSQEMLRLGVGHSLRLAVARDGLDAALEAEWWGDAAVFARAICSASCRVYPSDWLVTALSFARLAKLELYHGRFGEAVRAGERALRTLVLVGDEDSTVAVELRQIVAQARAEFACYQTSGHSHKDAVRQPALEVEVRPFPKTSGVEPVDAPHTVLSQGGTSPALGLDTLD